MKETAYLLQAALISGWWVCLASSPTVFYAFQFEGISSTAFWAFFLPDVILIAILSSVRAYYNNKIIPFVILGAFSYAALYCCNASLLTSSGFLPTGLMLAGLAYNLMLCFDDKLFRVSGTADLKRNAIKTLVQILCIWILALVVVPFVILDSFDSFSYPKTELWLPGGFLFLVFSSLGLASAWYMVRDGGGTPLPLDQTQHLVVSGPYRFVRNPMAIAGIGQGIAIATLFQSIPVLIYSILGAVVWHIVVRPIEEQDMVTRFGEPYLNYRQRVSCWFPSLVQVSRKQNSK